MSLPNEAAVLTLVEFLRARLGEIEQNAGRYWMAKRDEDGVPFHYPLGDEVLAEVEAKRRIIDMGPIGAQFPDYWSGGFESAWEDVLAYLALPYADHHDYREEWRP